MFPKCHRNPRQDLPSLVSKKQLELRMMKSAKQTEQKIATLEATLLQRRDYLDSIKVRNGAGVSSGLGGMRNIEKLQKLEPKNQSLAARLGL